MKLALNFLKRDPVLVIASILALISCFIVPPDSQYATYTHTDTIFQLISLMIVIQGLQRIGIFRIIGAKLLKRVHTPRGLALTFVSLTFFSAMFITNDVALVTFVPFALGVLVMAEMEDKAVVTVILMTLGANMGSMLTPIGNAHNLYLKALSEYSTLKFLGIMGPYSAVAAVLLIIAIFVFYSGKTLESFDSMTADEIERRVLAPSKDRHQPDEIRIMNYGSGYGGWRTWAYAELFVICLLGVGKIIPLWLMLVIVVVAVLFIDRRVFPRVDWALPITFCMFFIFIGNMRRVYAFYFLAAHFVSQAPLLCGVLFSQAISNVPTTVLLSGFSHDWIPLIIGTNLGGMGTLIASMASLVSYKAVVNHYPAQKGKYVKIYSAFNVVFLLILVPLALFITR